MTAAGAVSLLCGCGGKLLFSAKPDFDSEYTVNAAITCGELKAESAVTRTKDKLTVTFTKPDTLSGVTLEYTDGSVSGSLGDLTFDAEKNPLFTALPDIIRSAAGSLSSVPAENISAKDGVMTIDADFDGKKVTVTADAGTGDLISLKCPFYKLSVQFSDQKPYKELSADENQTEGGLVVN